MKTWIIWLLAGYGSTALIVSLFYHWGWGLVSRRRHPYQVKMLLYNSQASFEWAIRLVQQHSEMEGRPVELVVYDYGSTDHTREMLKIWQRKNPYLIYQVEERSPAHAGSTDLYLDRMDVVPTMGAKETERIRPEVFVPASVVIDLRNNQPTHWSGRFSG